MNVDGFGNEIIDKDKEENQKIGGLITNQGGVDNSKKDEKNYNDISSYKPTGNLIYNKDLIKKIEERL